MNPLWNFVNRLLNLLCLHILWLICSIPIFTIGASTTALYSVTLQMVNNTEGYLMKSFFTAWKTNFRQATVIWILLLLIGGFLGVDLIYYLNTPSLNPVQFLLMTFFFGTFVSFLLEILYVFPVLSQFDNSIRKTLGNALIIAIRHLPSSILMLSLDVLLLMTGFLIFPPILLLGMGLTAFINSFFLKQIFQRYHTS